MKYHKLNEINQHPVYILVHSKILIIYKLPFGNPSNPIIKANIRYYELNNLNPFLEYQLPETIIKLKQGFGRLIRTEFDTGIFIVTDPRIYNSNYGYKILNSFLTMVCVVCFFFWFSRLTAQGSN